MTADKVRKKERPNGMNSALLVLITFHCFSRLINRKEAVLINDGINIYERDRRLTMTPRGATKTQRENTMQIYPRIWTRCFPSRRKYVGKKIKPKAKTSTNKTNFTVRVCHIETVKM